MNEKDSANSIRGDILIYRTLSRRPRTFLHRNVVQALEAHQLNLEHTISRQKIKKQSENGDKGCDSGDSAAEHKIQMLAHPLQESQGLQWKLDLPSEVVTEFTRCNTPTLQIRGFQIRPLGTERQARSESSGWLPGPDVRMRQSCTLIFKFFYLDESVFITSQTGTLDCYGHGKIVFFDVKLSKPVMVEVDKLRTRRHRNNAPLQAYPPSPETFRLKMLIQHNNSRDLADFMGIVDPRFNLRQLAHCAPQEFELSCEHDALPSCHKGNLLRLKRSWQTLDTGEGIDYGVDIDMGWNSPSQHTLLTQHNKRRVIELQAREPLQLPTPQMSSSGTPTDKKEPVRIKWVFSRNGISHAQQMGGWRCAICQSENDVPHSSETYLKLHLMLHHDYLHFEAEETGNEPGCLTINISEENRTLPAKASVLETGEEECYIRSPAPFDESLYLKRRDIWTGHQKPRSSSRNTLKRGKRHREPQEVSPAPATFAAPLSPSKINEVLAQIRKRHVVPSVPNVMFYRNASKRRAYSGEMISDSDEEVDSRLDGQIRQKDIANLRLTDPEASFIELWNRHLERENLVDEAFISDALVRFARQHKPQLEIPELGRQFKRRIRFMEKQGILDKKLVEYCQKLVAQPSADSASVPDRDQSGSIEPSCTVRSRPNWIQGEGFIDLTRDGSPDQRAAAFHPRRLDWHPILIARNVRLRYRFEDHKLQKLGNLDQRLRSPDCERWKQTYDTFWIDELKKYLNMRPLLCWSDDARSLRVSLRCGNVLPPLYSILEEADSKLTATDDILLTLELSPLARQDKNPYTGSDGCDPASKSADLHALFEEVKWSKSLLSKNKLVPSSHLLDPISHSSRSRMPNESEDKRCTDDSKLLQPHVIHNRTVSKNCGACPFFLTRARDAIYCENSDCRNGSVFHIRCVGLEQRPPGSWYCSGCMRQ